MASKPSFYAEGSTALPQDTELTKWKKALGVYQSKPGANSANDPLPQDTLRQTKNKLLAALNN